MARKQFVDITQDAPGTSPYRGGRRRMDRYSPGFKKQLEGVRTFEDRLAREREERDPKNVAAKLRERIVKILERFATETIEHEHLPVLRGLAAETLSENEGELTEWITIAETVADAAEETIESTLRERERVAEEVRLEAERVAKEEIEVKDREASLAKELEAIAWPSYWWREGDTHPYPYTAQRRARHILEGKQPSGWKWSEVPWNRAWSETWIREAEAALPSLEATRLVRRVSPEEERRKRREWLRQREEQRAVLIARIPTLTRADLKLLSDEEVNDLKDAVDDAVESMDHRMRRYAREDTHHVIDEYRRRERFRDRISNLLEHYEEHVEPRRDLALNREARHAKWRGGRPGKHARRGHRHGSDTDPRREWRREKRRAELRDDD